MTIETQASTVLYVGDGAAVTFPVPFPVHQAEHLRLHLSDALDREIVMETGYSVSGAGSGDVSVTLSAPLPSGKHLAIARLVPLTQRMDLENGGSFDAETIERQFDITEMQIQQLQEQIDRGIKVPLTDGRDPDAFWLELLDASRAALEAYRATLALADAQALDSYAVNVRRSHLAPEDVPAGGVLVLPASYYPRRNILYLAVDGVVCTPRRPDDLDRTFRQYEEIGEDQNALSDRVLVHFPVTAGQLVDVWVITSNQSLEEALAAAESAGMSAAEAGGQADRAAGEARTAEEKARAAAESAAEAARAAQEAGQGTATIPDASPTQRGLEAAGGKANQIRRVNAAGTAYEWTDGLAAPDTPGLLPALGSPGQVPKVSADGQSVEWGASDGYALFDFKPNLKGVVDFGFLSICVDNGELLCAAFPEAGNLIKTMKAAGGNVVTMARYTAEQAAQNGVCARFALSDDGTKFRIPCAPDVFWRGLDVVNGLTVGMWKYDTMRPITGTIDISYAPLPDVPGASSSVVTGAFYKTTLSSYSLWGNTNKANNLGFNSALLGPNYAGAETAPVHAVCDYQMKMYGTVSETGEAVIAQMIAAMAGKLGTERYEADAWLRAKAFAIVGVNASVVASRNVITVTRPSAGWFAYTFPPGLFQTANIIPCGIANSYPLTIRADVAPTPTSITLWIGIDGSAIGTNAHRVFFYEP